MPAPAGPSLSDTAANVVAAGTARATQSAATPPVPLAGEVRAVGTAFEAYLSFLLPRATQRQHDSPCCFCRTQASLVPHCDARRPRTQTENGAPSDNRLCARDARQRGSFRPNGGCSASYIVRRGGCGAKKPGFPSYAMTRAFATPSSPRQSPPHTWLAKRADRSQRYVYRGGSGFRHQRSDGRAARDRRIQRVV